MSEDRNVAFAPLPTGAARWTGGFWGRRFELNRTVTLDAIHAALEEPSNGAVLSNFRVAAGLEPGRHLGTNWSDGDCYKWLEAIARTYSVTRDAALDATLDEWIAVIADAQADDGYISTQTQLDPAKERWGRRGYHELYNMGHLLTAASVHHRITGKDTFLAVARKLADYLDDLFLPQPKALAHFGWNPANIMGLVDLYRETSDARYLALAGTFVSMRGSEPWPGDPCAGEGPHDPNPGDQTQDRVPLREESHAVGHAVTATYLYAGAADVAAETGERVLLAALHRIWDSSAHRRMYVTGGVGSYHSGVSERGDRVHEAYGRDYELPNATAYNETCANIGNAMWAWRMLSITGEAEYGDVMETVIYNSGLSPISLDGRRFRYTNPLRWHGETHPPLSHDTPERWETHDCYCCPPQVARMLAGLHEWAYGQSDDPETGPGLWIHLYGSSQVDLDLAGGTLSMMQTTNYPWGGRITLTFERAPAASWTLYLRIPAWAAGAALAVNGHPEPSPAPGTYAALTRTWASEDYVELRLPMAPRLIEAHPHVEADHNHVAVAWGPVIYCLESADLPEGVALDDIVLPRDIALTPWYDAGLLGGVVTLEGEALRRPSPAWGSDLYRPLVSPPTEPLPVKLIPYYAWNNRGPGEMAVWLPLAR